LSLRRSLARLRLAPDGRPRPGAPFGRGPAAAHVLRRVISLASAGGAALPPGVAHGLARAGGTLEWATRPRKRRVLAENLSHALGTGTSDPAVRRLVRREIVNEAHRSADFLWAIRRRDELLRSVVVDGLEHVEAARSLGTGLILASVHVGGWEVAAAVPATVLPVPTTVLVRDDWLAWAVGGLRQAAGLRTIYDTDPALRAAALLRRDEALLVLADQVQPGMRSYRVRLLDAEAELPAGVAGLARLCGSPILPFLVLPLGPRRWRIEVDGPIAPPPRRSGREGERETLQALADRWTAAIRLYPEHWAAVDPMTWYRPDRP
jgi:Kdo2-lipid IVA lauroyltransferase/acyltransferase